MSILEHALQTENARLRKIIEKQDQAIRDMSVAISNANERVRVISGITIDETNQALGPYGYDDSVQTPGMGS